MDYVSYPLSLRAGHMGLSLFSTTSLQLVQRVRNSEPRKHDITTIGTRDTINGQQSLDQPKPMSKGLQIPPIFQKL